MKLQQSFLLLVLISFLSISASTEKVLPMATTSSTGTTIVYPVVKAEAHQKKLNFFQRLVYKIAVKKFGKAADTEKADRQATSALIFGIAAMSTLIIGLFVPYVVLAALPTGVIAMVLGKHALESGTQNPLKAKIGRTLGFVSLLGFLFLLVLVVIAVSSYNW